MNERTEISVLLGEVSKTQEILNKLDGHYRVFLETDLKLLGQNNSSAIVIAEMLTAFYTCLETLFVRISQFFENDLATDRWHKDLLHKMTLEVVNTRDCVISDRTHSMLAEFLKFRHFRRYYFDFEYDWDKITYLQKKYEDVRPLIHQDLDSFTNFLREISEIPSADSDG